MIRNIKLSVTTDADGAATAQATTPVLGYLEAVEWVDGSLADGVDATVSVVSTSSGIDQTLLTLTDANDDAFYYPRAIIHNATGGTVTGEYTEYLVDGYLKLTVAQGGSVKAGNAIVYVETE